jgi:DNA-binding CsgD family transcriptional regulator
MRVGRSEIEQQYSPMNDRSSVDSRRQDLPVLIDRILSCSSFAEIRQRVLEPLARSLDCRSGYFAQLDSDCQRMGSPFERSLFVGPIEEGVRTYIRSEFRHDPLLSAEANRLHCMSQMESREIDQECCEEMRLWRAFLMTSQVRDCLGLTIPVETAIGRRRLALTFHRGIPDEIFHERDVNLLSSVVPALRTVLSNLVLTEASLIANQIMSALADANGVGFVLFDEGMNIRHANERGISSLSRGNEPRATGAKNSARIAPYGVSNSIPSRDMHIVNLCVGSGETFSLSVTARATPSQYIDNLRHTYGLTVREMEVVGMIAKGHCNSSAAQHLGIALRTLENHLRAIYAKLGIGTRTQLVSRALTVN